MITFSFSKKVILSFLVTGLFLLQNTFAQVPTITSFTPANGQVQIGQTMSIHGSNFSNNPADLIVRFGPAKAKIINASTTSLDVIVPYGANSGSISVQNIVTGRIGYSHTAGTSTNHITITRTWETTLGGATYFDNYYNVSNTNGSPIQNTDGDFNNDGKTDILTLTTNGVICVSLRNLGNSGFFPATPVASPGGTFAATLPVADFNGDGNPDFATLKMTGPNSVLNFYMGAGDGTFAEQASSVITQAVSGSISSYAVAADFNRDGKMDIAFNNDNDVFLYVRNAGNTGFTGYGSGTDVMTGIVPGRMDIGDFNNDGYPDIAFGSRNSYEIAILLTNAGSAGFSSTVSHNTGSGSDWGTCVDVTDYNNDGNDDIIFGGNANPKFGFMSGNGLGGFTNQTPISLPGGIYSQDVEAADFNGDGYVDIAVINYTGSSGDVRIYEGDGTTFGLPFTYTYITSGPACGNNYDVDIVDYNDDGAPDILAGFTCVGPPVHENISIMYFRPSLVITSTIAGPYCADETVVIGFASDGISGNVHAELSDINGSFASPVGIGTSSTTPINATIPPGTTPGTGYRIRLVYNIGVGSDNNVDLEVLPMPTAEAGIGQDICPAGLGSLNMAADPPVGTGTWTGPGTIVTPNSPTSQITGLSTGSHLFTWTVTSGSCVANDFVTINVANPPAVNPISDDMICASTSSVLFSTTGANATIFDWTTGGDGSFTPSGFSATYSPGPNDIANGSVALHLGVNNTNGACVGAGANFNLLIANVPDADAGDDMIICTGATVDPDAIVSGAGSLNWTTSGSGSFSPNNLTLVAVYTPSAGDIAGGGPITLTLNASNGPCPVDSDPMQFTFTSGPDANAGTGSTVCTNSDNIGVNGAVLIATGGEWTTTGTGTFTAPTSLNTTYNFSAADKTAGVVGLILTTTGNGSCPTAADDTIFIVINPSPAALAGTDLNACKNNPTATLNGGFTGASSATWNGGGGLFGPNSTTMNATYTPSAGEITAGSVTLTLITNDPDGVGPCIAGTDPMQIVYTNIPIVEAGNSTSSCTNNPNIPNSGAVTIATGGTWSTSGTGTFTPSANSLNAVYHPTPADTVSGSVILTLTTTGNGNCLAVNDTRTVIFTPKPSVEAGSYSPVCSNTGLTISGSINGASGLRWSTPDGNGTFNNQTNLTTKYHPTRSDGGKTILLIATTTGNGTCLPVKDTAIVSVLSIPNAYPGENFKFCDFSAPASLNADAPKTNEVGTWSQASGATTVVFDDPHAHVTEATNLIAEGEFVFQWKLENTVTGCKDSSVVHVFQCELPEVVVFNVLSPNADGKHDFLELEYAEVYPKNRVLVYNRWGEIVFEATGYDNKDVTFTGKSNVGKGDDLPDGTYYYVIIPKEGGENEKGFFVIRH